MKNIIKNGFAIIAGIVILLNSCIQDKPDAPPATAIPFDPSKVLNIAQVKQMLVDSGGIYTFTENYSLFGVVVMDEKSGNIYESSFMQDSTGGIQLNFIYTSGMYLGDSVRILLKGGTVELYHGLYEIQNLDPADNVFKIANGKFYEPKTVTIEELNTNIDTYQCTLIRLDSVQFTYTELGKTYADSAHFIDENRTLEDCLGNNLLVRTSGYADFANDTLPDGKGSIIAIASLYDSDVQLVIREPSEVHLDSLRCGGNIKFFEGFDEGMGQWEAISLEGDQIWTYSTSYGNPAPGVTMSGYAGTYYANEDWLISPSIDLSGIPTAFLSIETAKNYNGNALQVKISTDYDGSGDPESFTWTDLEVMLSPGGNNWEWVPSGKVDISAFIGANVHIAFRYTSTNSACATWELDNIKVSEN